MTPPVRIRAAAAADLPAIAAIYGEAVRTGTASYEFEPPTLEEMTARFDAVRSGGFPWLVAETDSAVVGYAYAGPFRTRPGYRFTVEDSIYLAPDVQGRGIGRKLLESLIAECEQGSWRQMVAVIGDGGVNLPSVRLHERLGFMECGRLQASGFKFGRWCDTLLMQRALSVGAGPIGV